MKTNIIFSITCALIFGSGFAEDIQIGIRMMNPSLLKITCFGYAQTVAMVKIFRGQINFISVVKIIIYNGKCDVLIETSELEIQCICMSEESVVCNVSGSSFNSEAQWKCAAINYQDSNPKYSRHISMSRLYGNNTDGQVSPMLSFFTKLQKSTITTDAKLVLNTTHTYNETDIIDSTERKDVSTPTIYANTTVSFINKAANSDITTVFSEVGTFVTAGLLPNTFSDPFIILLATCGCLITLLVAALIWSHWKRICNTGPDLPPVIENNYLTPFGENPRTSQYVLGREASDQHDNVALRQIDNIASRVQGVITARIVLVDKESRTGDEIDSANNYDSISDTTPEPEMPYAEIPTQDDGEGEIEYQGEMQTHYESLPRSRRDAFAQGRTWT